MVGSFRNLAALHADRAPDRFRSPPPHHGSSGHRVKNNCVSFFDRPIDSLPCWSAHSGACVRLLYNGRSGVGFFDISYLSFYILFRIRYPTISVLHVVISNLNSNDRYFLYYVIRYFEMI